MKGIFWARTVFMIRDSQYFQTGLFVMTNTTGDLMNTLYYVRGISFLIINSEDDRIDGIRFVYILSQPRLCLRDIPFSYFLYSTVKQTDLSHSSPF